MTRAYILIQTEVGDAGGAVAARIAAIKGVTRAENVTGPYDVIVQADTVDTEELNRGVLAQIQAVDGVQRTLTCPTLS